jgi:hypothetical protein
VLAALAHDQKNDAIAHEVAERAAITRGQS